MPTNTPPDRGYTEKEVGALIKRATELQEQSSGVSTGNLSLTEIEHIATELGLSPEHLRTASVELETGRISGKSFSFWGAPFVLDETRIIDEELSQDEWLQVVMELRRFSGNRGQVSEMGRAREWAHYLGEGENGSNFEKFEVTIRTVDGKTAIEIRKTYGGVIVTYLVALGAGTIFSLFALNEFPGLVGVSLAASGVVGALGLVRTSIWMWERRFSSRLRSLATKIQEIIAKPTEPVLSVDTEPEMVGKSGESDGESEKIKLKLMDPETESGSDGGDSESAVRNDRRGLRT